MSLTITIRPAGATSGGNTQTLPAEGDNGNQEIDTQKEAEAALAFLPEGSTNVVNVGSRDYTRAQLIEIRDRKAAPAPDGEKVPDGGVSHGVLIGGDRTWGIGDNGHTGNRFTLAYVPGIPLTDAKGYKDKWSFHLDGVAGLTFGGHSKSDYETPGGESVESSFRTYAATVGAHLRITPPIGDKRLYASPGVRAHVGKFTTAEGTTVSLPATCTPGDFGRGECEPNAGARTGNAGTTGLYNDHLGAARETSGLLVGVDLMAGVGYRIVKGESVSLDAQGGFLYSLNYLSPKDGHGLTSSGMGGFLEVIARLGGADTYVPLKTETAPAPLPLPPPSDKDGDGIVDTEDKCPDVKGTKENAGCPPYNAKVLDSSPSVKPEGRFGVVVEVSEKSEISVQFKDAGGKLYNAGSANADKGQSVSEFRAPATLSAGKYKLVITMKDPASKVEKVEERDISIVERVEWTVPGSFAPGQNPAAQDIRVVGQSKLEGVSYAIVATDADGKEVGKISVTDKPGNIEDKKGKQLTFKAPDINGKAVGWQKDITYRVALLNKDGNVLDVKSFTAAPLPPAPKGGGKAKKSGS